MSHIEQTRAVVEAEETHDGRIIPAKQAEIDRPVRLRANSTVFGSVYGGTVEADENATVEGSVMASDGIDLEGAHITGEVGTPDKVTATDAHVDGTVTGKRVLLSDCVVRGNVVGSEVILEDCVVLGIATADRSLTVENSLCYTVHAEGEAIVDELTVVLPQAIMKGAIDLQSPVAVAGLGSIDVESDGDGDGRLPEMDADDLYEQGDTTYLTLAPRILNLQKVTGRLSELEDAVMTAVDDTSDGAEMSVEDVLERLKVDTERISPLD